ncbi:MAG: hypothetical protein WC824_07725 [Bacteroidota bacterium]|jgi:hypothetical protein
MNMESLWLFKAGGDFPPKDMKSRTVSYPVDVCWAVSRELGVHFFERGPDETQVWLTVEETLNIHKDDVYLFGVKKNGDQSPRITWRQGIGCTSSLSCFVCETILGLIDGTIGGQAKDRLSYLIFWTSMRKSPELREWMKKNFPEWWDLTSKVFGENLRLPEEEKQDPLSPELG